MALGGFDMIVIVSCEGRWMFLCFYVVGVLCCSRVTLKMSRA
jgi:hypothetical protein